MTTRVAVVFHRLGPYHWARLEAATKGAQITAIELSAETAEYKWDRVEGAANFKRITVIANGDSRQTAAGELAARIDAALGSIDPDAVAIPGWWDKGALAALRWCVKQQCPAIVMSESTEWDEKRVFSKEWIKRRIVGLFSAALVGGKPHADYMAALGMPRERIFSGYDAVDNEYFAAKAETARTQAPQVRPEFGLPANYFLASARFVVNKNLPLLIEAYARYRELAAGPSSDVPVDPWSLVLLGDGPIKADLCRLVSDLSLQSSVHLPGFKQYVDLPTYYGLAKVFIHASTAEPWGLVVNEAMACGLSVLVSNRCGCASDLVQQGSNGFTFNPRDTEALAQLMLKVSAFSFPLSQFGLASTRIIANWGLDAFALNLRKAVDSSLERSTRAATHWERLLLWALLYR